MGDNSSIKMVSNALTDTRVEVESGSVIVECDEIPKDNSIELLYKNNLMMLVKHGLYRINTEPAARLQVYDGEAIVKGESGQLTLKTGKETSLNGVLMAENFDKKETDDLYSWSSRRASYLATANASSAMTMRDSGGYSGYSGYSSGLFGMNSWQFNPMFGMFTYVPMMGFGYSPFGYGWYSPYTIGYYMPVLRRLLSWIFRLRRRTPCLADCIPRQFARLRQQFRVAPLQRIWRLRRRHGSRRRTSGGGGVSGSDHYERRWRPRRRGPQ